MVQFITSVLERVENERGQSMLMNTRPAPHCGSLLAPPSIAPGIGFVRPPPTVGERLKWGSAI